MRNLWMALVCACVMPVAANGETYKYNKMVTVAQGNTGFNFDRAACVNVSGGSIDLTGDALTVDNNKYTLKPKRRPGCYRAGRNSAELKYHNQKLQGVKLIKPAEVVYYYITPPTFPGTTPDAETTVSR